MNYFQKNPLLSICIPAYNRAQFLRELLDSIFLQEFLDCEIVIAEDCSPERDLILKIVQGYIERFPGAIRMELNRNNLGYDGNLRRLIEISTGRYCLFLGNDDLLVSGALKSIKERLTANPDCGVLVRTYATFEDNPSCMNQIYRYFSDLVVIPPGIKAISWAYRRSVVIPGMVIERESALAAATTEFDGTLLYQLYLVGMILSQKSVIFSPDIVALRREGNPPDFGNSSSERLNFTPKEQTPSSSLFFVSGMLRIAKRLEELTKLSIFEPILSDIGAYSFPILAIQASRSKAIFFKYSIGLAKLGLWRSPYFYFYFIMLFCLGSKLSGKLINMLKYIFGRAPHLGIIAKT
jgi:abequosyltransferase